MNSKPVLLSDGLARAVLGLLIVIALISVAILLITGHAKSASDPTLATLMGTLIGYLVSEAKQVIGYYFGSSAGSERKTELLAQSTPVPTLTVGDITTTGIPVTAAALAPTPAPAPVASSPASGS